MLGGRLKLPATIASLTIAFACASTEFTTVTTVLQLTGTFSGIQDGTANGISFEDEQIIFLLIEVGDSVTGTYDVTGLLGGDFVGVLDRADQTGTFVDFVMNQIDPCVGSFAGRAEARVGTGISGNTLIGVAGTYMGTDCNGAVDASFFIQN